MPAFIKHLSVGVDLSGIATRSHWELGEDSEAKRARYYDEGWQLMVANLKREVPQIHPHDLAELEPIWREQVDLIFDRGSFFPGDFHAAISTLISAAERAPRSDLIDVKELPEQSRDALAQYGMQQLLRNFREGDNVWPRHLEGAGLSEVLREALNRGHEDHTLRFAKSAGTGG